KEYAAGPSEYAYERLNSIVHRDASGNLDCDCFLAPDPPYPTLPCNCIVAEAFTKTKTGDLELREPWGIPCLPVIVPAEPGANDECNDRKWGCYKETGWQCCQDDWQDWWWYKVSTTQVCYTVPVAAAQPTGSHDQRARYFSSAGAEQAQSGSCCGP